MQVNARTIQSAGLLVGRLGLVAILVGIGLMKFTSVEAEGIRPLIQNSPFMAWMYSVLSVQGVSIVIGITELVTAALLLSWRLSPSAGALGAALAAATFMVTLSFMVTTPGVLEMRSGTLMLGGTGQFLLKDLTLLGAALVLLGESIRERRVSREVLAGRS